MRLTLVLTLVSALGAPVALAQELAARRITVTGEARVDAVPDLATVTGGVQIEAVNAADALGANAAAMAKVFTALEAAGVARADYQTSQLSLDPVWTDASGGGQPRVTGYSASNFVTIRVRDISRLGGVIDALSAAGANRILGIGFEVADPRLALDAAREAAVADARAKAELMAKASGVSLGAVQSIREGGVMPGPQPVFRAEAMMDNAIAAGTVSISAQVEIVYAIE